MRPSPTPLLIFFLAVATTLLLAPPATATQCSRDCSGSCGGGCTVNSIDCSTACTGGSCPGTTECFEYGGTSLTCTASFKHDCEESGTPGGPETQFSQVPEQSEWAVVKYRTDEIHPVSGTQVDLVAASTPRFGGLAVNELVRSSREGFEHRMELRQKARARGTTPPALPEGELPVVERVHFVVDTAGACIGVKLVVPAEAPEEVRGSGFFRVIAGPQGEISAVSPLWAGPDTDLPTLSTFLRQQGQLLTDAGSPVETYLYLRVNDAGVSYITGSASRLF